MGGFPPFFIGQNYLCRNCEAIIIMTKIGITTTVPIEVIIAAGYTPVDLNNLFITSESYSRYIDIAEREGFPKSLCAWTKGIYGACIGNNIREIVGVIEGDCSNTKALIEVLKLKHIRFPFRIVIQKKLLKKKLKSLW